MSAWTAEDDARLCALLDEGHSASIIAARIGRSRNAILGRVHRLGMRAKRRLKATPNERAVVVAPKPRPRRKPVNSAPAPSLNLTFDQLLERGGCKYATTPDDAPPDGHRFCGQPRTRRWDESVSPYCQAHHSVVYTGLPAKPRKHDPFVARTNGMMRGGR